MKVKHFDICNPKKYTKGNEEKTFWANVGKMTEFTKDDGSVSRIIEMHDRNVAYSVFEQKPREDKQQSAPASAPEYPTEDVSPEDIPFN